MKQQKILVIGAGGQLGSELTQGLWNLHGKDNVIATDMREAEGVLAQGNFAVLNVLERERLFDFIKKNNITQVYHLAAVLSATGEKNPKFAWQLNDGQPPSTCWMPLWSSAWAKVLLAQLYRRVRPQYTQA